MGKQIAQTASRQDIATQVAQELNVGQGLAGDPDSVTAQAIITRYEQVYSMLEWGGNTPWNIDLTPVRVVPGIVEILKARLWSTFKGEGAPAGMEARGWALFHAANAPDPSWAPVAGQYF